MQEGVWWAYASRFYPDTKHYNIVVTNSSILDNGDNTWHHSHRVGIALAMITRGCRTSLLNQLLKVMNRLWKINNMQSSSAMHTYGYMLKHIL
jgi:hypothetical protein